MDAKLRTAAQAYANGRTCSQAVFCAYADEMGLDQETACRIMEGFGGGVGGMQEVCGALAAMTAVISYYYSNGNSDNRQKVFEKVQQAAEVFRREYGGITCREILHGEPPKPFQCGMKAKDAVLIIEKTISRVP